MAEWTVREMRGTDRTDVAELICLSTNYWYQAHGHGRIFGGGPETTTLHFDLYSALEGSSGVVAEHTGTGRTIGSCFYHIRPTHVSLGIMNAHPNYFGRGVARSLLEHIIGIAEREGKPLRFVSSAMNLDSYSLYTRARCVPRRTYQDMIVAVPPDGIESDAVTDCKVRDATLEDVPLIAELELAVSHIRRDSDYRHFIRNPEKIWHASVIEGVDGELTGFLASCGHTACNMVGPGFMRTEESAAALLLTELNRYPGRSPVFLVPVECAELVQQAYAWGARNCEMHVCQVRGPFTPFSGVNMPTFMPETG